MLVFDCTTVKGARFNYYKFACKNSSLLSIAKSTVSALHNRYFIDRRKITKLILSLFVINYF